MNRTWLVVGVVTPLLFAALPLATLFFTSTPGSGDSPQVTVTITVEPANLSESGDSTLAMRSAPEPQPDCSYESNPHIEG